MISNPLHYSYVFYELPLEFRMCLNATCMSDY